jgi:hypothetical protein
LLASIRTTVAVLVLLVALMGLSVAIPQRGGVTGPAHDALVRRGGVYRFLLVDLELGHLPTSRIFLAALGVFFVNLTVVLGERTGVALRRCRVAPPGPAALAALLTDGVEVPEVAGSDPVVRAGAVLRGLGYLTADVPEGVWGLKNRWSPLGFPIFHLSFFLLWIGGSMLWYTRSVGILSVIEGEVADTAAAHPVKRSPAGPPPNLRIAVDRVEIGLERGLPVGLGARLAVAGESPRDVWVNDPLVAGATTVLVERAGVAPVFRLEDAASRTRDRIAIAARTEDGKNARTGIGAGDLSVEVEGIPVGPAFPLREALPGTALTVRVRRGEAEVFAGALRPGGVVPVPGGRIVLEEVRYWVGLRIVHERGGGVLVAGFLLGVAGIVLRMLWFRREVAALRYGDGLKLGGRAEFFHDRFRAELSAISFELARPPPGGSARP